MIELINGDFRNYNIPEGIVITDPPYNQDYYYNEYRDKINENEYILLLSKIPTPCIIIHYPEETINLLPKAINKKCEQVVSWVYNSNTGKQSRLISWWGCKPDFSRVLQPYKNLDDKRIRNKIENGILGGSLYDWWKINQVKNVGKEKSKHPCQIPEKIIRNIILTTVDKNETIIDVFGGSGTTNKVALELGYNSIYYEIDKKYYNIAKERIDIIKKQQNLF